MHLCQHNKNSTPAYWFPSLAPARSHTLNPFTDTALWKHNDPRDPLLPQMTGTVSSYLVWIP